MRKEDWKDGDKSGFNFYAQSGDKVIALTDKPYEREALGVRKDGKPFKSMKYGQKVKHEEHGEIFLTYTAGQRKALKRNEPLTGKTIVFEEYKHPEWGMLIGARVQK